MNVGGISSFNNTQITYTRKAKQSPNFGMALKFDKDALPVIKKQAMGLSASGRDKFWSLLEEIKGRQENNPVNIIVRKTTHRDALAADIIDSTAETEIILNSKKQGLFSRNGSLKFLEKAETDANELNKTNEEISKLPIAEEKDYYARGVIPNSESIKVETLE